MLYKLLPYSTLALGHSSFNISSSAYALSHTLLPKTVKSKASIQPNIENENVDSSIMLCNYFHNTWAECSSDLCRHILHNLKQKTCNYLHPFTNSAPQNALQTSRCDVVRVLSCCLTCTWEAVLNKKST